MEQLQALFILHTHDYVYLGFLPGHHCRAFTLSVSARRSTQAVLSLTFLAGVCFLKADMQQKKEPVQDDSDLDRKRRETEALLQSIGISPEPPLGT